MCKLKLFWIVFFLIVIINLANAESFSVCGVSFSDRLWKLNNGIGSNLLVGDDSGNLFINSTNINTNSVPPIDLTNSLIVSNSTSFIFVFNSLNAFIRGSIVKTSSISGAGTNHLIVKNKSGANVVKFDASDNNIYLLGNVAYN
jgi:hypothetical protein